MTKKQRRLVWSWIAIAALLFAATVFHWVVWVMFPFAALARASVDIGTQAEEAGRKALDELVDDYPWLKWWFTICALVFFGGAIYLIRSGINPTEVYGFKVVVIAFAIFIAPQVMVMERERFQAYGESSDAV